MQSEREHSTTCVWRICAAISLASASFSVGAAEVADRVGARADSNTVSERMGNVGTRADPLLAVDKNRSEIVDRLMTQWSGELPSAQRDALKGKVSGLRADRLLAASLVGSFDGVLELLVEQEKSLPPLPVSSERSKALGDANRDLPYTPIAPCKLIDTRGLTGTPITGGAYAASERRSYAIPVGACPGLPTSGLAALLISAATSFGGSGGGILSLMNVAATAPVTNIFGSGYASVTTIVASGSAGQFDAQISGVAGAHLILDIVGYFAPPPQPIGDITEVNTGTASTTGLTGGVASGIATLTLAPSFKLPQSCATNQIAKWNGSAWACAADDAGPANAFVQGGNTFSALGAGVPSVLGNNDNRSLTLKAPQSTIKLLVDPANGDDGLRISYATNGSNISPNTINGSRVNSVAAGITGATVAGGGGSVLLTKPNQVNANFGTIGGGLDNTVSGRNAVVAGGVGNTAGSGSNAQAAQTVGGGSANIASGDGSTVPGGVLNLAAGDGSFAAGQNAQANHNGAFVWGDNTAAAVTSTGINQFVIRANGGIRLPGAGENEPGNAAKQSGTNMFTHVVPASGPCNNTGPFGLSRTAIDHPLTNDKPDAILVVTPSFGALSAGAPGYTKPVVVFYDDTGSGFCPVGRWVISNPNGDLNMVAGMKFNVFVINP